MSYTNSKKLFILVDCNNFFVSCERLFNPKLEKQAVLVLSNNDGCVIARSQETKDLGIGMGEPYFKVKEICDRHRVTVFSSNFQLYGDISCRVMSILASMAPAIEMYSIDEAFLEFPPMDTDELILHCQEIRKKVRQWVGIPVSLGIGPTKTLAKSANKLAKKDPRGFFDLSTLNLQEETLQKIPVGDIWGIGYKWEQKLRGLSISTAKGLRDADLSFIRKQMGATGERIALELRGVNCLDLEEPESKKSITCSRSFGKNITEFSDLAEALSTYVVNACVKLRNQACCARSLCVYLEATFDSATGSRDRYSTVASFPVPTNDTPQIITLAKTCLEHIFCEQRSYKKCGVILLDLVAEKAIIPDFFLEVPDPKRRKLAETVDALNAGRNKNTVFYGAMGVNPHWKVRSEKRSRYYTTSWDELAIVKA